MASGTMVGADDEAREKQRFGERKVYTRRKVLSGQKKDPNAANAIASATENNATATYTVINDNSINNSTFQKSNAGEAKSNSDNVLAQPPAPQQAVSEDGNLGQPPVGSGLEDGDLVQPQLEKQNMVQTEVGSGLEDGSKAQPQGEDQHMTHTSLEDMVQPQSEDGDMAQLQLEDQNMVQPQSEDEDMAQLQLEDQNIVQPRSEDGGIAQLQLEGQDTAQPQLEDQDTAQPQLEDQNTAKPLGSSRFEDENMAQPQASSRSENGNMAQLQVSSRSEDGNTALPQVSSKLEGRKSPQPQVNSRLDGNTGQPPVVLVSDDLCSRQPDEPSSLNVQQEDDGPSSPIRQQEEAFLSSRDLTLGEGVADPWLIDRIKLNLASKSKQQMLELRWKLECELDVVRSLVNKIEVKQSQVGGYGNSNVISGSEINNVRGAKCAHSEVATAGVLQEPASTRSLHQLSLSMLENSQRFSETVEKEKRTPKANQFYHNSEFLLAKDKFPPAETNKKSKLNWKKQGGGEMGHGLGMRSKFFKSCISLLDKLMNHAHGWVFNTPVDVEGLGLHDYFTIITHPMDLGTVKSRMNKNWYKSPKEFAEDVRLTFHNAMTYNPKGHEVHMIAEKLSKIFENRWAIIESNYNREMRHGIDYGAAPPVPSPLFRRVYAFTPPPPIDTRRVLDRSESMTQTPKLMGITPSSRTPAPKKPKAKDPHKRDMTFEEKQKLSTNLQSLPTEKVDAIVQIIKKINSALNQHDDEIEVDIDSLDPETLWELDRLVTNYKKSLSKNKRKAELAQARAEALQQNAIQKSQAPAIAEIPKETQTDERNLSQSLPVQEGNQPDNGSSSSSSSSDSGSSSSDSDSDSSSASGSDAGSQGT